MKVLHINRSDIAGGAAIAAYRLHKGLLDRSVSSEILAKHVSSTDKEVNKLTYSKYIDGVLSQLGIVTGLQNIFTYRAFTIKDLDCYQSADIINLHNLHVGYFNYLSLPSLTRERPAVYTLHDMWAFTGHCAYSLDCNRWETGCGHCKYPDSFPPIYIDNTRLSLKLKSAAYRKSKISIVTPSRWLEQQARKSILGELPIRCIPNGLNLKVFRCLNREYCREILSIPKDRIVLMYGAENLDDPRKGAQHLEKALRELPGRIKRKIHLLSIGRHSSPLLKEEFDTTDLGYVDDDHLKTVAYNCADIFLFMSHADNLPLVLQESMACGTPMVAFDIGGVPELVRSGETGYVVKLMELGEFNERVIALIEDSGLIERMRKNCRDIAEKEYGLDLQVDKYIDVYNELYESYQKEDSEKAQ